MQRTSSIAAAASFAASHSHKSQAASCMSQAASCKLLCSSYELYSQVASLNSILEQGVRLSLEQGRQLHVRYDASARNWVVN